MSYDSSAFCGNVIQLTAKETFPPELLEFVGCRTVQCSAQPGARVIILPQGEHGTSELAGDGKEQGCHGGAAWATKDYKKQPKTSPNSALSHPQLPACALTPLPASTPGQGHIGTEAGLGGTVPAPASHVPSG